MTQQAKQLGLWILLEQHGYDDRAKSDAFDQVLGIVHGLCDMQNKVCLKSVQDAAKYLENLR